MSALSLLRFQPILKEYLWGGRRLGTMLDKPIGDASHYAESWEVVDHGDDQSVVTEGPWSGTTLHELVARHSKPLLGRHHPQPVFPLLLKFLDAAKTLSVQVHPNDIQAALLQPPDLGKTEAWVVLDAEPGSKIFAGLKRGVDRAALEQALAAGNVADCLHQFEPAVGDCIFLEAGTVHAIGAGLVIAEIQQASNTTYRLFDWNRVDQDGNPRELHISQALEVIDYGRGPVFPQRPQPIGQSGGERLVECNKFVLNRWGATEPLSLGGDDRCRLISVIDGSVTASADDDNSLAMPRGTTILAPACCGRVAVEPEGRAVLLEAHLP